ncbi:MAG: ATP-binding protein, partial [Acidimicrobiia bacterium]|nr:ATP-binding protein [Acidimicrobiia bacterium]
AVMNAMEHGNGFDPDVSVDIRVLASAEVVSVEVYDQGGDGALTKADVPDLGAKLAGIQSPRGWGLFLINNMVDNLVVDTVGSRRLVRLEVKR